MDLFSHHTSTTDLENKQTKCPHCGSLVQHNNLHAYAWCKKCGECQDPLQLHPWAQRNKEKKEYFQQLAMEKVEAWVFDKIK